MSIALIVLFCAFAAFAVFVIAGITYIVHDTLRKDGPAASVYTDMAILIAKREQDR